jgi:NAD(P) transhydrogenase subunit alpha
VVQVGGVQVVGVSNAASAMPTHASFLYARNVAYFANLLTADGRFAPDWSDEVVVGSCILREGAVVHAPTAELLGRTLVGADSGEDEEDAEEAAS